MVVRLVLSHQRWEVAEQSCLDVFPWHHESQTFSLNLLCLTLHIFFIVTQMSPPSAHSRVLWFLALCPFAICFHTSVCRTLPFQLKPRFRYWGKGEGVYLFFMTPRGCRWIKQHNPIHMVTFSFDTRLTEGALVHLHCSPHRQTRQMDDVQMTCRTETSMMGG